MTPQRLSIDQPVNPKSQFYVYEIRDPRPGKNLRPIYVGKGQGRRAHIHWRRAEEHENSLLRAVFGKISKAGLEPVVVLICRFEVEADAFLLEVELIAKYGRRNLGRGFLCNLTDGGEGTSGSLATIEHIRRLNADPEFAKARNERMRKMVRKLHANPEYAKANAERAGKTMRKLHTDPAFAQAAAERMRKQNADPEFVKAYRAGLHKLHNDPEFAKAHAERMRKRHTDPEFVKVRDEGIRKLNADPEFAKAQSERAQKQNANPEFIKAAAERLRKLNVDPAFAKARNERAAEGARKRNADPEFQRRAQAAKAAKYVAKAAVLMA